VFDINYIELFKNLPPQLATLLIAMIPIAELRVSIPVALGIYQLPVWQVIFFSIVADILIATMIIYYLGPIYNFLSGKSRLIDDFFAWIFRRTRKKFEPKYEIWGNIALMLFVAVPLPITGAWTGSIASWLFGMPKSKSLFYVSLGVIISAGIVTLVSLGAIKVF